MGTKETQVETYSILYQVVNRCPSLSKDLLVDGGYLRSVESLISSALSELYQGGFSGLPDIIWTGDYDTDIETSEWEYDFMVESNQSIKVYELTLQYISQYVTLMFDPPPSQQQQILEKSLERLLWRIRLEVDDIGREDIYASRHY